jgi:hypothetical protein
MFGGENMKADGKSTGRFYAVSVFIIAILACASISAAFGQERSSDRDKPTLLTSNKVDDDLDGSDSQYFYKFTAGPGKLTLTFEVKASGTNAGAILALFDAKARPLLSDVLAQGVDGGSERQVNSVQLSSKQNLLLSIKGLRYGDSGGRGTYTVTLDGPVTFAPAAAPAPAPAAGPAPANPAPAPAAAPAGNNAPPAVNGGAAAPAASSVWSGQLDPTDERMLFRNVRVSGAGQVTFSFNVKAIDAKAAAKFVIMDEKGSQPLGGIDLQGGEGISKPFTFAKAQTLLIMIAVNKDTGNVGRSSFTVEVTGPAQIDGASPNKGTPISGQLDPAVAIPSFHVVNVNSAGQGSFTFSVKATDAKATAKIAVMEIGGLQIVPPLEVQGGESVTKAVTFNKPRTITVLVLPTRFPDNSGRGTYSIELSGPVTVIW